MHVAVRGEHEDAVVVHEGRGDRRTEAADLAETSVEEHAQLSAVDAGQRHQRAVAGQAARRTGHVGGHRVRQERVGLDVPVVGQGPAQDAGTDGRVVGVVGGGAHQRAVVEQAVAGGRRKVGLGHERLGALGAGDAEDADLLVLVGRADDDAAAVGREVDRAGGGGDVRRVGQVAVGVAAVGLQRVDAHRGGAGLPGQPDLAGGRVDRDVVAGAEARAGHRQGVEDLPRALVVLADHGDDGVDDVDAVVPGRVDRVAGVLVGDRDGDLALQRLGVDGDDLAGVVVARPQPVVVGVVVQPRALERLEVDAGVGVEGLALRVPGLGGDHRLPARPGVADGDGVEVGTGGVEAAECGGAGRGEARGDAGPRGGGAVHGVGTALGVERGEDDVVVGAQLAGRHVLARHVGAQHALVAVEVDAQVGDVEVELAVVAVEADRAGEGDPGQVARVVEGAGAVGEAEGAVAVAGRAAAGGDRAVRDGPLHVVAERELDAPVEDRVGDRGGGGAGGARRSRDEQAEQHAGGGEQGERARRRGCGGTWGCHRAVPPAVGRRWPAGSVDRDLKLGEAHLIASTFAGF